MLRLILCLATVLPAILAQGGSMDSFEEFVTVLRAGYHTAVNYDSDFCESSTFPVPIVLSVHFDRWQYIEGELQVPSVLGVQTFMTPEGANVIVYSIVSSDGHATAESFVVSGETGQIIDSYILRCTIGVGAFFVDKGVHQPDTTLATYDELLTALMESRRLFIAASLTDCGHPLPPEVYLAEGGSTYYHFYVVPGEAGEDVLVVEYPGLALSEIGEGTVFTMHRLIVSQDGSVSIRINYFNTLTWEDEYPFPEGFQCVLGESARFRYDSGDAYDSFPTYAELETAFLEGKHIRASFDSSGCSSPNETLPDVVYAGIIVVNWLQVESGEFPGGVYFSQFIIDASGDMVLQEYYTAPDNVLYVKISIFDPTDPGNMGTYVFLCPIGEAAHFAAHSFDRTELTDYSQVLQAELDGAVMSIMFDFDECVDPTGQLDLSGSTFGAYFQDLAIFYNEGLGEMISGSAFAMTSDPVSLTAYVYYGTAITPSNNATIFPGYWHFNENGEWVNDYDGAILECSLGGGVTIIREA